MVLNNDKPYELETSDEEDPWEMIGDDDGTPLIVAAAAAAAVLDDAVGDIASGDDGDDTHQSPMKEDSVGGSNRDSHHHIGTVDLSGVKNSESSENVKHANAAADDDDDDVNASFISGVSSITRDHRTISDIEEDEKDDVKEEEEIVFEKVNDSAPKEKQETAATAPPPEEAEEEEEDRAEEGVEGDYPDVQQEASAAAPSQFSDETDNEKKKDEENSDPLVDTLSEMGFEKEQIEKAIGDLKDSGETEIDADSVIGSMMGEENNSGGSNGAGIGTTSTRNNRPQGRTWSFVESTVQDLENHHQLRHRTHVAVHNINRSAREIWSNVQSESQRLGSNIRDESQRFRSNFQERCDRADVRARDATTQVKYAASNAKDSIIRANEEYGITEKLATAAVVGGATLLVLGNPRAGVGAMAVAGASLAAGEAMRNSQPRAGGSSRYASQSRDFGLREGVHLD